jgi:hypothetical protein
MSILEYFAPKTRYVTLNDGVGHHVTSRGGRFVLSLLNDQYNSHDFWAYTAFDRDTGTYSCGLYNYNKKNKVSFEEHGFATEQEAADALDRYAGRLAKRFLKARLEKLKADCKEVEGLLRSYRPPRKGRHAAT